MNTPSKTVVTPRQNTPASAGIAEQAFRARLTGAENKGRIAWLAFRGLLGWRLVAALLLMTGVGIYWARQQGLTPQGAFIDLVRLFALFTLILASPLLPDERSQGTLEILWLTQGTLRRLLRWKAGLAVFSVAVCAVPAVALTDWYLDGELHFWWALLYLVVQAWLLTAWAFYVGSFLPQAWAGGLVATTIAMAAAWPLSLLGGSLNPFMKLYATPQATSAVMFLVLNRLAVLALAWFLHDQTARRTRAWFQ